VPLNLTAVECSQPYCSLEPNEVGQAIGSGLGGAMLAHGRLVGMGYVGIAFLLAALGVLVLTRRTGEA